MKFYPYKKACALLVTGALTTGAAVPALAAEAKTEAPQNAEESHDLKGNSGVGCEK